MSIEKLIYFHTKKLGNHNLIHRFIKGTWIAYLFIVIILCLLDIVAFIYWNQELGLIFLAASFVFIVLLFYIMIYRRAKRYIRNHYQLRSFKEVEKLKEYLLVAYLEKSGFKSITDLDLLIEWIASEGANDTKRSRPLFFLELVLSIFIAILLAILCGSLLFQLGTVSARIMAVIWIIVFTILTYASGITIYKGIQLITARKKRASTHLIHQIIRIKGATLVSQNSAYHPYLSMERKTSQNAFLMELISTKTFI